MYAPTTVDLTDLESVISRCLAECRHRFGPIIDLSADHYWLVWPEDAFDLAVVPSVLAGQIGDAVASVGRAAHDPDPMVAPWHELSHALGILTRLAAMLMPSDTG